MNSSVKTIFFGILFFAFSYSYSQPIFAPGYIITNEGDTIKGRLKDIGTSTNVNRCVFKGDDLDGKKTYKPGEISCYHILGDKKYRSEIVYVKGKFKTIFAEVLLEGEIYLFYNLKNNKHKFYIQKKGGKIIDLSYDYGYFKTHEHTLVAPVFAREYLAEDNIYKRTLDTLFRDCPRVTAILPELDYDIKSMKEVSKEYLRLTSKKSDYITFEGPDHPDLDVKIHSGLLISQTRFVNKNVISKIDISPSLGIEFEIPLDYFRRNFSIQAGGSWYNIKHYDNFIENSNDIYNIRIQNKMIGVPLSLRYTFVNENLNVGLGIGTTFIHVLEDKSTANVLTEYSTGTYDEVTSLSNTLEEKSPFFDIEFDYKANKPYSYFLNIRAQTMQFHTNGGSVDTFGERVFLSATGSLNNKYILDIQLGIKF